MPLSLPNAAHLLTPFNRRGCGTLATAAAPTAPGEHVGFIINPAAFARVAQPNLFPCVYGLLLSLPQLYTVLARVRQLLRRLCE